MKRPLDIIDVGCDARTYITKAGVETEEEHAVVCVCIRVAAKDELHLLAVVCDVRQHTCSLFSAVCSRTTLSADCKTFRPVVILLPTTMQRLCKQFRRLE